MKCPICSNATARAWRPFCSKRCADIDLGRWMTESYVLPDETDAPEPQNPLDTKSRLP